MKIALPIANGLLATHFGHCETFAFVETDPEAKRILGTTTEPAPEHQPGLLPTWLARRGVDVIIAGGMGQRAQDLFAREKIRVVVGAPALDAESLAQQYLDGVLESGENICDH